MMALYIQKKLTGSNNGDYIYFQIKCNNIFSDEDYNINIVIYNG